MGLCFSCAIKVSGSSSSNAAAAGGGQQCQPAAQNRKGKQEEAAAGRRAGGKVPCGKRTDFGYDKDFQSRYAIGKLLGHGQFGYTFVATNKANGEKDDKALKEKAGAQRARRERGPPADGIPSKTKVMVANLPYDLTEEKVSTKTLS